MTNPMDPGSYGTAAGFDCAFDRSLGAGFGAHSSSDTAACPSTDDGTHVVKGIIRDKDRARASTRPDRFLLIRGVRADVGAMGEALVGAIAVPREDLVHGCSGRVCLAPGFRAGAERRPLDAVVGRILVARNPFFSLPETASSFCRQITL
jgi:hypothetical protein